MVGSTFAHYEIEALLGAGGMGQVYRARDTKLGRAVAIKFLLEEFATDPERLARFQREAELLAALNHPNIAAVYGLEEANGAAGIVLELVDGETLADKLATLKLNGSRLPVDEALDIARQIADALEAAHDKGVIHRDLKPGNIKLTSEGRIKVLDFGLAKMLDPRGGSAALTMSPTLSIRATQAGVILGTAAYMSPEQARGKPVDHRTDVWSFGCVLFEMLAGAQSFEPGETVSDAIASVLAREPDWNALPPDIPSYIRVLLRRCLQKDPKRRLPHIGVARLEIEEGAALAPIQPAAHVIASSSRARTAALWANAAAIVIGAGVAAAVLFGRSGPIDVPPVRFPWDAPEGMRFGTNVTQRGPGAPAPHFAPSPDGRRIAYVMVETSPADAKPRLWVRGIDAFDGQPLAGTEDASFPFWSPDSRFVAFFAQGKLKKIDVAAGSPQTLCDAPLGEGGTWNRNDEILFARDAAGGLFKVSAAGGAPAQVTNLDKAQGEISHAWPQFLPDGRHFLYLARARARPLQPPGQPTTETPAASTGLAIYGGSLDSADRVEILKDTARAQYASGHLLFTRGTTLMAQAFDQAALQVRGSPEPVAEDVPTNLGIGRTGFAVSDRLLLYRPGWTSARENVLAWYDRSGRRLDPIGGRAGYRSIRLSPGDKALAAHITTSGQQVISGPSPPSDLWIFDLTRQGIPSKVTHTPDELEDGIVWSPDGSSIVYAAGTGGGPTTTLMLSRPGGVGEAEELWKSPETKRPWSWSPDGKYIAFYQASSKTSGDIWLLPMTGDRQPKEFIQTPFNDGSPMFSPNGRWIAYTTDKDGGGVYVRSFPAGDREWRISQEGGAYPQWSGDGKELFFIVNGNVMAAEIKEGPTFEAGVPRKLFDVTSNGLPSPGPPLGLYSVSADGSRILVIESADSAATRDDSGMAIVVGWASTLKPPQ
jgi:hypothetical protein